MTSGWRSGRQTEGAQSDLGITTERDLEETYRSGRMQINPRILVGTTPAIVFLIAHHFTSLPLAILTSLAASAIVFAFNGGHGIIRALSVLSFTIVCLSAGVGLILRSEVAFVAQNLVGDISIAIVSIGSILIGRPLMGAISRDMAPGIRPVMAIGHPVFVQLTLVNVGLHILSGGARIGMISVLPTDLYVILSRVAMWPIQIWFVWFCYRQVTRAAIRIWPADLGPPVGWVARK